MLYQQVKKVLANCCVSLTFGSSSLSGVEEAELCLSTIQKIPCVLAVKIVVSWVRLGFIQQFRLEGTSGVLLAKSPAQSSQLWGRMRLLRALIQSGIENPQGWRLYNLTGQPVPVYDCLPGWEFFFKPSLNLSCFSLCLALSFDDLLIGTGGLLLSALEVFPSPGWIGTLHC